MLYLKAQGREGSIVSTDITSLTGRWYGFALENG